MFTNIPQSERPEIYERSFDNLYALVISEAYGVQYWHVCEFQTESGDWSEIYFAGTSYEDAADVFSIYNDDMDALIYMFNQPNESPVNLFSFEAA